VITPSDMKSWSEVIVELREINENYSTDNFIIFL
jgi:hypothetical protein